VSLADHFLAEILDDLPLIRVRRAKIDEGWREFRKLESVTGGLEKEAGIDAKTKQFSTIFYRTERTFFPAFGLGLNPEYDRSWAEYHDKCRTVVRDGYFAVEDVELRKRLINAQYATEQFFRNLVNELHYKVYNDVTIATHDVPPVSTKWFQWIVFALMMGPILAYKYSGALLAISVGFPELVGIVVWAVDVITKHAEKSRVNSIQLRQALVDLEDSTLSACVLHNFPYFFSVSEVKSGIRETGYIDELKAAKYPFIAYPPRVRLEARPNGYRREQDGDCGSRPY
jgi:hypothetical protein